MSFAIFGAIIFYGILWALFPRTSFAILLKIWIDNAYPGQVGQIHEFIFTMLAVIAIFGGLIIDCALSFKFWFNLLVKAVKAIQEHW
jgi:hypothetical protein